MAIAPAVPGLEVTVEVDNIALPEYQYEDDAEGEREDEASVHHGALTDSVTKYLEVPSGAEFSVRWVMKEPFDATRPTYAAVMLDGFYLNSPQMEIGDKDNARGFMYRKTISGDNDQTFTQTFRFSELDIDDQPHSTEGLERQLEGIGTITVYIYFVIGEQETSNLHVPRLDLSQLAPMNEKISQKCAPVRGDVLTHQASLTKPQEVRVSTIHSVETEDNWFASFTFHYRSTHALKSLHIIPRTPSPSRSPTAEAEGPATQPDLTKMTNEQLIAELGQRRRQDETAVRIKREYDDAFIADDGDEVEWVGTRPVRTRVFGGVIE